MNTKTLLLLLSSALASACATTQAPLRQMHVVADGWVVAAYDKKSNVHLHARKLQPVAYSNKPAKEIYQTKQIYTQLGDTLQSIAESEYGNPYMWDIIAMGNNIESPYTIIPGRLINIPLPSEQAATGRVVDLDQWELRMVNSSSKNICAAVDFMDIDYYIDVQSGWFHAPPYQTLYLGRMTQEPWVLADTLHKFNDAKWVVNTLTVVPFKDEVGCDI